jgi:hypothetical protein
MPVAREVSPTPVDAPNRTFASPTPVNARTSHGYRVVVGIFVLLIAVALAVVFYMRMQSSGSTTPIAASGKIGAGVSAAGTSENRSTATSSNVVEPPKSGVTTNEEALPNPNDTEAASGAADQAAGEPAPENGNDVPIPTGHHHRGGGPVQMLGTFTQGGHRDAATVYIVGCNGERFYIYEYLNRPGFRAILPPDTGHPIGGRDFETYEDAVHEACE